MNKFIKLEGQIYGEAYLNIDHIIYFDAAEFGSGSDVWMVGFTTYKTFDETPAQIKRKIDQLNKIKKNEND